MQLGDGIEYFKRNTDPEIVASLLEACSVWIDPKCYRALPVWSPYTYRKAPLYKANWVDRQLNKKELKFEGNVAASISQNRYLGIKGQNSNTRPNWTCCHIWGNDDPEFKKDHAEVNDPRYFTCAANMVLLPSPMKTFTDTVPEVKAALRFAAYRLYGFYPEGREKPTEAKAGQFLPATWKEGCTIKYAPITDQIKKTLTERVSALEKMHASSGANYPRKRVKEVVAYWQKRLPDCRFREELYQ